MWRRRIFLSTWLAWLLGVYVLYRQVQRFLVNVVERKQNKAAPRTHRWEMEVQANRRKETFDSAIKRRYPDVEQPRCTLNLEASLAI